MITAVDTNVLLDILLPEDLFFERSKRALENAATAGSVVICELVYAELCVHFETQQQCASFLTEVDIHVQALSAQAMFAASRIWRSYRRQGGRRTRILSDFLIGAHAQLHASRLLTRDRGFYRRMFPSLKIWDPAEQR